MLPSDQDLSTKELDLIEKKGRILLLACGALAREILDIIGINAWTHMDLKCLPAILHNTPEKITPLVREHVEKYQSSYDKIFVVYADCGTGGLLATACQELGVEMIAGPHCYSFFEGNALFEEKGEVTSFYLTDFLVRQFDAFVWEPLGLDKHPALKEMYFGNYTTLVYQSQIRSDELIQRAKDCADRLGLSFEHRHTGYGDLEVALKDQA